MNAKVTFKTADQQICITTMPVPPRIGEQIEILATTKRYTVDNVVWEILAHDSDNYPSHQATVYVRPLA